MDINERLGKAELVVYGQVGDVPELPSDTSNHTLLNYTLNILCVMKKEAGIEQVVGNNIIVSEEYPAAGCYSNRNSMKKGTKILVMLSEKDSQTGFHFSNVNVQSAVFPGDQSTFGQISICGGLHTGIGSECPQFGVANETCTSTSTAVKPSSNLKPLLALAILTMSL